MELPHGPDPISLAWVGHTVSLFTIGGTLFGLIPALAASLAVIWYIIEISESQTVRQWIKARRLKKLIKLRIATVALELYIRQKNGGLESLDEANQVHQVVVDKSTELTHKALAKEQQQKEGERIEKALLGIKSTQPGSPEDPPKSS